MPETYTPFTWATGSGGGTAITAARLNNIETGVESMDDRITAIEDRRGSFNVKDYGATGDGSTNDRAAIQAAIDAAATAGGGRVFFPRGYYKVGSGLTVTASDITLEGENRGESRLEKTGNFTLLQFAGATGAGHINDGGVRHLTLRGGDFTGVLLDVLYGTRMLFEDLHLFGNTDIGIDMVELWDSRFMNVYVEWCSGTTTAAPAIYVRSSRAASGTGSSTDSTNQIYFFGCLVESWKGGAIRVEQGTGSPENVYSIHFYSTKIETDMVRGPGVHVGTGASNVSLVDTYVYMHSFDAGYSTAVDAVELGGTGMNKLDGCYIGDGAAVLASGVNVSGSGATVTNVEGFYDSGAPTSGSHVRVTSGTNYTFGHLRSSNATNLLSGLSTSSQANAGTPVRAVAGAVSDASFPAAPGIGTLAVDTTNGQLYAKTAASTWGAATLGGGPLVPAGQYYMPLSQGGSSTSALAGNGSLRLAPWVLTRSVSIDRIGMNITTASTDVGALFRLGIYGDDGTGYPGALLLDAGTVAVDSTGSKTITISQTLAPGIYWIGGAPQSITSSSPSGNTLLSWPPMIPLRSGTSSPGNTNTNGYEQTGVTGALPANFTTTVTPQNTIPRLFVRAA